MRWWPTRPARNAITTQHIGPHLTSPPYQVSPKLFFVTNLSIGGPCHSSLGGLPSEALIASLPRLLHLSASIRNSLFVRSLCLSVRITLTVNVRYCHLPPLIATPCYKLAKTIYWRRSTSTRLIIQLIETQPVSSTRLINPRRVNCTNQIFLTAAIRKATRKGYTKSVTRMLTHIQRAFIYSLSRKVRRFNTQMKDLTRWMLILLVLRSCMGNVEASFPQSPDSTNTWKTAALALSSPRRLVPLPRLHLSLLSLRNLWF